VPPRLFASDRYCLLRDSEAERASAGRLEIAVSHVSSMYRCSPCKQIAPFFAELSAQYAASAGISFMQLDVDECEEAAVGVSSMPTFKYYSGVHRACCPCLLFDTTCPRCDGHGSCR
jgi:hypothetical protein